MAYRVVFVWLLVMGAASAFADPDPNCKGDPHHCDGVHEPPVPVPGPIGDVTTTSVSDSAATASNQLDQVINLSLISIGGDALAGAGATGTTGEGVPGDILSPKTEVNVITNNPDKITIKNTPSMMAPDIFPTVSCFKPVISGALSWAGFGASAGGGVIDEDCVKREYIRLAFAMGMMDRAAFLWCQQEPVWEDFGSIDKCLKFEVANNEPTVPGTEHVTHEVAETLIEQQALMLDELVVRPLRAEVAEVSNHVAKIEQRLDAGAAASRQAAKNEAMWKDAMAERYLDE